MDVKYAYVNLVLIRSILWRVPNDRTAQLTSHVLRVVKQTVQYARPAGTTFSDVTESYAFIEDTRSRKALTRLTDAMVAALIFPHAGNHDLHGPAAALGAIRETLIGRCPSRPSRLIALALVNGSDWAELCRDSLWMPRLNTIDEPIRTETVELLAAWEQVLSQPDEPNNHLPVGATTTIPVDAVLNSGVALAEGVLTAPPEEKTSLFPEEDDNDRIAHRALLNIFVDSISRNAPDAYTAVVNGVRP